MQREVEQIASQVYGEGNKNCKNELRLFPRDAFKIVGRRGIGGGGGGGETFEFRTLGVHNYVNHFSVLL